jgi:hypothetical protein
MTHPQLTGYHQAHVSAAVAYRDRPISRDPTGANVANLHSIAAAI